MGDEDERHFALVQAAGVYVPRHGRMGAADIGREKNRSCRDAGSGGQRRVAVVYRQSDPIDGILASMAQRIRWRDGARHDDGHAGRRWPHHGRSAGAGFG